MEIKQIQELQRFIVRYVKKRIMDIEKGTKGSILVKCPKCKNVSRIAVAFRLKKHNPHYQFAS